MACPVDVYTDVINSQHSGLITVRQREDLIHLIMVGDEHLAAEGLKRIKAEKQTETQHLRSKHHNG
jgi:hypothetical protein